MHRLAAFTLTSKEAIRSVHKLAGLCRVYHFRRSFSFTPILGLGGGLQNSPHVFRVSFPNGLR